MWSAPVGRLQYVKRKHGMAPARVLPPEPLRRACRGLSTALFPDPPLTGEPWHALPDAGIQPELAYKLLWLVEAGRAADHPLRRQRDGLVDTRNGHQPLHAVMG